MARLLLSIPVGANVRNLLRTGAHLPVLAAGHEVVILSPASSDPEFARRFSRPGVTIAAPPPFEPPRLVRHIRRLDKWRLYAGNDIETLDIMKRRGKVRKAVEGTLARALLRPPLLRALDRWKLSAARPRLGEWLHLLREMRPDLVFATCPHIVEEFPLLAAARDLGIPAIGMIQSWDNPSSKGTLPFPFRRVIVWNGHLRDEMIRFYGYRLEEIFVSGIPQFDLYPGTRARVPRERLFADSGLDPARRLILYTTAAPRIGPREPETVALLARAVADGSLRPLAQVLVRLHFRDDPARYAGLRGLPHVVLESPGRFSPALPRFWDPDEADMEHFAALLAWADVEVNIASTVTIDAVPHDLPVVNVAFDGAGADLPYHDSARRYYDYTHYARVVATDGVKVARSPEELTSAINAYLADRSIDREGRARIVAGQCHLVDGKSAERIGRFLAESLEEVIGHG